MLPIVGYFLATMLVMSGLIATWDLQMAAPVLSILILATCYRHMAARCSRGLWIAILSVTVYANVIYWCQWAAVPVSSQFLIYGLITGVLGAAFTIRQVSFLSVLGMSFPLLALVHMWGEGWLGGERYAGVLLMAWTLALWPYLTLVAQGRLLIFTTVFGVIGIPSIVYKICCEHDVPHQLLGDMVLQFWAHSSIELTIIQCGIVVVSVAPLLINSGILWRWISVFGTFFIAGPLFVIAITGPWYADYPLLLWWVLYPAVCSVLVGIVGMLCTVRQVELLNDTAVRSLALGIGASAILLIPLIHEIPNKEDMIVAMAPALAPLMWGALLAVLIGIASLVARHGEVPAEVTESWHDAQSKIVISLRMRWKGYVSIIRKGFSKGRRQALNPGSFVPILIFTSTWSVFGLLHDTVWFVVLLVLISFIFAKLWSQSILLWTLANALLVISASVAFSMHWVLSLSVMASMIMILWLFVRWPSWNASWVYTSCLIVVTMVQVPILMYSDADPMPTLLACGVAVLLCNGLQGGHARWLFLPLTSLMMMAYLWWWIDRSDPFALKMILNTDQRWFPIWYCTPTLLMVFYVLMWSRQRMQDKLHFFSLALGWREQALIICALVSVCAWCFGWRPGMFEGGLSLFILVINYRTMYERLRDIPREATRWPLLDALTLLLACLLIHAGECYTYYLEHQRQTGTVQAGSLSGFVASAERDVYACVFAAFLILVGMRLRVIGILLRQTTRRLIALVWKRNVSTNEAVEA